MRSSPHASPRGRGSAVGGTCGRRCLPLPVTLRRPLRRAASAAVLPPAAGRPAAALRARVGLRAALLLVRGWEGEEGRGGGGSVPGTAQRRSARRRTRVQAPVGRGCRRLWAARLLPSPSLPRHRLMGLRQDAAAFFTFMGAFATIAMIAGGLGGGAAGGEHRSPTAWAPPSASPPASHAPLPACPPRLLLHRPVLRVRLARPHRSGAQPATADLR
jgi:hypothetical protein